MDLLREKLRARTSHRLYCSSAPDLSGANAAALEQAKLSRDQLDWVKGVYASEAPARQAAQDRANAVSDAQLKSMQQQDSIAQDSYNHYKTTFQPIETQLATQAQNYDTPSRRDAMAGQAIADVGTQAGIAQQGVVNDLAARGVDASSGNAAAALAQGGVQAAAAKAAAGNSARQLVETTGHAYMEDAANLGRGIASAQGTQAGIALNAGNASVGNSQTALNTASNGVGMVQQGYGTAINGLGSAAQNMTNIGKVQADTAAANSQGMGSLAGAGMMALAV